MALKQCSNEKCKIKISDLAKTCPKCGTLLANTNCKECGKSISDTLERCPECGNPNQRTVSDVTDISAAVSVFETLCNNYQEKVRFHYRIVISYIVACGTVIFFLIHNKDFLPRLHWVFPFTGTLLFVAFTSSCLVWFWKLEKSMQANVVEICQLRHILLEISFKKEGTRGLTAFDRNYKPKQLFYWCQFTAVIAVSLLIVGLLWLLWHQQPPNPKFPTTELVNFMNSLLQYTDK